MLQAAYYALFKLGRFGFYLLVPGHTNAYSLLTNALLMCRFAPPLAFNFMAALAMPASKHDERHDVTETVRSLLRGPKNWHCSRGSGLKLLNGRRSFTMSSAAS